jgi:hypothetical protein
MRSLIQELVSNGKYIARTVELFGSWHAILRDGLEEQDSDEASNADESYSLEYVITSLVFCY